MIVTGGKLAHFALCSESASRCFLVLGQRFVSTLHVKEEEFHESVKPLITEIPVEEALREKQIDIKSCGLLFEKWRQEKKYWSVPKSEIPFTVRYIDTGHQGHAADTPTVVSLPGSPGSYNDFTPLTTHLHRLGVRVIAPNFPGAEIHPKIFRSTPEEKSEYINDFLQALHVPRVDMLVCHSSALFPGLFLSLGNRRFSPKSLALVNPTTLEIPRVLTPFWLASFVVRAIEFPFGLQVTGALGKIVASKPQLKKGSYEEHLQSAKCLMNAQIPKQVPRFQSLLDQNYPVMMAFSENDKLIHKKSSLNMAKMMMDLQDIETYDKNGKKQNEGNINPFRKVMSFENGTHFLFKTYPSIVSEAISSFLFSHLNNRVNFKR